MILNFFYEKKKQIVKIDKKLKCFGGEEVDAIKHWRSEIVFLIFIYYSLVFN